MIYLRKNESKLSQKAIMAQSLTLFVKVFFREVRNVARKDIQEEGGTLHFPFFFVFPFFSIISLSSVDPEMMK